MDVRIDGKLGEEGWMGMGEWLRGWDRGGREGYGERRKVDGWRIAGGWRSVGMTGG